MNVRYPVCSGPTNAGIARATDTAICIGYPVTVYNNTHEARRSQIHWSWERSTDGGFSWFAVPSSLNVDTLYNIVIAGAVKYRTKMVCETSNDSTYSVPVDIRIKLPYECYCYSQSNGGQTDTADIGSVVVGPMVNTTGGPHIMNGDATKRRTDYTYIPIIMKADSTYRISVFHTQPNAIHADALVSVFLDYDNDLTYNVNASPESERVYQGKTRGNYFYVDTFIRIPNTVIPNVPTGMRVILNHDLNPNSPANMGCGPYVSGETEDYVVKFVRVPQSVANPNGLQQMSVYPNPTNGQTRLMASSRKAMEQVSVSVNSITGQAIFVKEYDHIGTVFSAELNMSEVAKGIYFITMKTRDGDKMVQKVVVE